MSTILLDTSSFIRSYATQERSSDKAPEQSARQGRRFRRNGNGPNSHLLKQRKFEGLCEELNGHVYKCVDASDADQ